MSNKIKILHVLPSGTRQYNMHGWIAYIDELTVGHIHMVIEANDRIKFLDAWVHEDYRRKGIFRKLWETRWKYVKKEFNGYKAYAWAKPMSLPLLLEKGFEVGDSTVYVEKDIEDDQSFEAPFTFVSC